MFRSSGLIEILKNPEFFFLLSLNLSIILSSERRKGNNFISLFFFSPFYLKNSSKSLSLVSSSFTLVSVSLLFMGFIL